MSAFLIEQKEYRKFAVAFKYATNKDVEELADGLYQVNVRAVNYRYKENNVIEPWKPLIDDNEFICSVRKKCMKFSKFHLMAKLNDFIETAVYQCSEGSANSEAAVNIAYRLKRYITDTVFKDELIIHGFDVFNL